MKSQTRKEYKRFMDNEYGIKETVRDFFGAVLMFAFFVVITVLLFSM